MDSYKSDKNDDRNTNLDGAPLIGSGASSINNNALLCSSDRGQFPGLRRENFAGTGPPNGSVLLPTAGNALQAVPADSLTLPNTMAVRIPGNAEPGQTLLVLAAVAQPMGTLGKVTVPANTWPGHTILVQIPDDNSPFPVPVVPVAGSSLAALNMMECGVHTNQPLAVAYGVDVVALPSGEHDLQLNVVKSDPTPIPPAVAASVEEPPVAEPYRPDVTDIADDLLLVHRPENSEPGSCIRVQISDGRVVEAVTPLDPTVTQFYIRVPPTVNQTTIASFGR